MIVVQVPETNEGVGYTKISKKERERDDKDKDYMRNEEGNNKWSLRQEMVINT